MAAQLTKAGNQSSEPTPSSLISRTLAMCMGMGMCIDVEVEVVHKSIVSIIMK